MLELHTLWGSAMQCSIALSPSQGGAPLGTYKYKEPNSLGHVLPLMEPLHNVIISNDRTAHYRLTENSPGCRLISLKFSLLY